MPRVYKNMARQIVALVFRCTEYSGNLASSSEVVDLRWMTADEIRENMDEAYACRLLDALEHSAPAVRSHDGSQLLR